MAKYNFFISYCRSDGMQYAKQIARMLTEKGYTVWLDEAELRADSLFLDSISEAISNSDCFLPIITERYNYSEITVKELAFALERSISRAQKIVPLVLTDNLSVSVSHYISKLQWIRVPSASGIEQAIDKIDRVYGYKLKSAVLYEKLVEFKNISNDDKTALTVCELIDLALSKWENLSPMSFRDMQSICNEISRLYGELISYVGRYDADARRVARTIIDTINRVEKLFGATPSFYAKENPFFTQIYFASVAIRILYADREIRQECADILTNGDVHNSCSVEWYIEKQAPFVKVYDLELSKGLAEDGLSREETLFVLETEKFIFSKNLSDKKAIPTQRQKAEAETSEQDDILLSIAKFMQEGNKLFDILQERGIAGDFLSCLLTSYERLKNYCEVVGAKSVAADCVDRIVEIRNAIEHASDDVVPDERAENGIKSLLGFTLKGSGNYDLFISFKSEDSDLAERIYNFSQQHMKVPFWSKRTLPQLSKSEYEDAIYEAIRKSKHFVVVISDLKYLNANWIKREMAAFDRAITEGRKKNSNFVFVVTDDVYREIIACNKMCLDERYCGYQILKMSEFEDTLMSYIV